MPLALHLFPNLSLLWVSSLPLRILVSQAFFCKRICSISAAAYIELVVRFFQPLTKYFEDAALRNCMHTSQILKVRSCSLLISLSLGGAGEGPQKPPPPKSLSLSFSLFLSLPPACTHTHRQRQRLSTPTNLSLTYAHFRSSLVLFRLTWPWCLTFGAARAKRNRVPVAKNGHVDQRRAAHLLNRPRK